MLSFYIQIYVCRYWTQSSIKESFGWLPCNNFGGYNEDNFNSCIVNVRCGESYRKFQLKTYSYRSSNDRVVRGQNITDESLQEETIPIEIETSV